MTFISGAQGCEKCPRLAMSRRRILFPQGNDEASIMFVADFPTRYEDMMGEAFEGFSWEDLGSWLTVAGLSWKNIFLTHLIKCRPPYGKKPTISEVVNCSQYLEEELEAVRPAYVIAFSARVFNFFVPKEKRGKVTLNKFTNRLFKIHQVEREWGTFRVVPLPSPSYASMGERESFPRKAIETLAKMHIELKSV